MPHEPTAPPGARFFARLDRFHCECPNCTALLVADVDPRRSRQRDVLTARANQRRRTETARQRARANPAHPYNPFLQALTCPSCGKVYLVGLLLWSVPSGSPIRRQPADTKPTRRQLAELRQYTVSTWATQFKRPDGAHEVNVAVVAECTCPIGEGSWAPGCPIHGWEQVRKRTSGPLIEGE